MRWGTKGNDVSQQDSSAVPGALMTPESHNRVHAECRFKGWSEWSGDKEGEEEVEEENEIEEEEEVEEESRNRKENRK